jgi:hypothetical protein
MQKRKKIHTHCNPKHLGVIGFVVIAVESFFANRKGCLNRQRVLVVDSGCGEVFVNVVHRWYDSGDAGRSSGKEQCRILENLMM